MQDKTEWVRVGFGPRAAAFLLDQLLVGIALLAVRIPGWLVRLFAGQPVGDVLFDFTLMDVICYLLMSAYFVLLTFFTGSTLGKKVMGIKVMGENEEPLRFVDVLYRETIGRYLSGLVCIGYLMVLVDHKKRGFHDYLCNTCVVYDQKRTKSTPVPPVYPPVTPTPAGEERGSGEDKLLPAPVSPGYTIPGGMWAMPARPEEEISDDLPEEEYAWEESALCEQTGEEDQLSTPERDNGI